MVQFRFSNARGFTLVEVVIVIVVSAILLTVALRSGKHINDSSKMEETKNELKLLSFGFTGNPELQNNSIRNDFGYIGDVGSLPPNLDALISNPGGYATWDGPYIGNITTASINDYKTDSWGAGYQYSGGITITSNGSGQNITQTIATSSSHLLYNKISGEISDINGTPPRSIYKDSIAVKLTIPDGSGNLATHSTLLDGGGYFSFDSIPIGNHQLQLVYTPTNDTIVRYLSVSPNSSQYNEYNLSQDYWVYTIGSTPGGGSGNMIILRPIGEGNQDDLDDENCSDNWECVDDVTSDNDGTYVKGDGSSWENDTYDTENPVSPSGTIDSVIIFVNGKGSSDKKVRTRLRISGNNYNGSQNNLSSSYALYSTTYAQNPATSVAWTWTDIENLEIGVGIRKEGRVTQVYAEVYFTN